MNVCLTPPYEAMNRMKFESGLTNNGREVVRKGLRPMEYQGNMARLRAAIAVGIEEIARGEGVELTPELLAEIDRETDRILQQGEALDPDVCP